LGRFFDPSVRLPAVDWTPRSLGLRRRCVRRRFFILPDAFGLELEHRAVVPTRGEHTSIVARKSNRHGVTRVPCEQNTNK
jgi:hypothetical protein